MAEIDLSQYGINGTTEIVYNPSFETLFEGERRNQNWKAMKRPGK